MYLEHYQVSLFGREYINEERANNDQVLSHFIG